MNICFIGQRYRDNITNGVHISTLTLAREIAKQGHKVFIYGISNTNESFVDTYGIVHQYLLTKQLVPKQLERIILQNIDKIDIYCFQSVFTPVNFLLSRIVFKANKPYVVFPRGGYNKNIFKRNILKKYVYFQLFEKKYLYSAAGVICISDSEISEIKDIGYKGPIKLTYNPIIAYQSVDEASNQLAKKIIYLGRFDIQHKGIDLLITLSEEIQKRNPAITIELYGSGPDREKIIKIIQKSKLSNISVNEPVYGEDKLKVMKAASAYIHMARWEGFGRSIAEAMMFGLPCIISADTNLAVDIFKPYNIGLVLGKNVEKNAEDIVNLLNDNLKINDLKLRTQAVAVKLFDSTLVASKTIDFLDEIVKSTSALTSESARK